MEAVLPEVADEGERAEAVEAVVEVEIEVGEGVGGRDFLTAALRVLVVEGEGGGGEEVEPRAAHSDVERGAVLDNRAAHAEVGRGQADGEVAVVAVHVAGLGDDVHHAGEASAVAGGKRALVEGHIANGLNVVGREESAGVVHLVDGIAVDEEKVLVVVAAAHHQSGKAIDTGRNAGLHLQGFDHVGIAHQGGNALDVLRPQIGQAHGGSLHFVLALAHDEGAFELHGVASHAVGRCRHRRVRLGTEWERREEAQGEKWLHEKKEFSGVG